MEIGKMISRLRNERGLNQRDFAKFLGVSNGAIGMWETGKRQPDLETIKKIASFFNVTVDYLIGNQQSSKDYANYQIDAPEIALDFKMRISDLMAEQKMPDDEYSKKTGYHPEDKDANLYGNRMPSIEDLIKIAGALSVSTDYLLNMSHRKRISQEEDSLLQLFNRCDDECKKYLLAKAGVLCVEGISAVAAGEYGKYVDEEKKSFPSSGTEGKRA